MPSILEIRVGPPSDALDRFEAAWNRVADGRKVSSFRVLTLEDLPGLVKALSPARWAIVQNLRASGEASIYELAKRLSRDYKNVHTDVTALGSLGLIERENQKVLVPWDVVRGEF